MPIEDNVIRQSITNARELLKKVAEEIEAIQFPPPICFEIQTNNLSDKYINDILKSVPAGYAQEFKETDFIYIFKLLEADDQIKVQITSDFTDSRSLQQATDFEGKKDFCRVNDVTSDYLYIGRSQKLRSRLKQHLDAGSEGIFAMHMLRWGTGINCKIEISYYRFDKLDNLIIQALEDGLWQSFIPMFGRKGEK